jgi:hypothetical protein
VPPPPGPPTPVEEIELSGPLENVAGACPSWTFVVQGRTVFTTSDTKYERGSCQTLKSKTQVRVEGWRMSDETVRADTVRYEGS